MNKADLILEVAEREDVSKSDAEAIIEQFLSLIESELIKGNQIKLSGFGVFEKKVRKARKGTDPSTHAQIIIPESSTIVFRPSKLFKGRIK